MTSKEVREAVGGGYDWSEAGSRRFKGVKGSVDVYNIFNANSVLAQQVNYTPGATNAWRQPLQVMGGRLLKFTISGEF